MKKLLFLGICLFFISFPLMSQGQPDGGAVRVGPGGVQVEVGRTPPPPVIVQPGPVVVEKQPVVVEKPVVVEQPAPKSGCACNMAADASPISTFLSLVPFLAFGLGITILRKRALK